MWIEVTGEGATDVGKTERNPKAKGLPDRGVVPPLLSALCGRPENLRVRCQPLAQLQHGNLQRKVRFAKEKAYYNKAHAAVFVVDTEGDAPRKVLAQLRAGRDEKLAEFPMAVGVAHPCIEAWLLADADAIRGATRRDTELDLPPEPESLPAPRRDRSRNPKTELARLAGEIERTPARVATEIARSIRELSRVEASCPEGFAPFAEEVRSRIAPLFSPPVDPS
ncbi:MAG: DUF4276 family protein [Isosphaeraceae bacterium]